MDKVTGPQAGCRSRQDNGTVSFSHIAVGIDHRKDALQFFIRHIALYRHVPVNFIGKQVSTVRRRCSCLFQKDMEIFKIEKDVVQAGCFDLCRGF